MSDDEVKCPCGNGMFTVEQDDLLERVILNCTNCDRCLIFSINKIKYGQDEYVS